MGLLDARDAAARDRPVVRAIYCRHLVALLGEEGITARAVLEGTGLRATDLDERNRRISYAQQLRVYENALALSRRPGLGLRLGRRQRISDHGVIGYALQSSADLAQAVRIAIHYQATTGPLLDIALEADDDVVALVFHEVLPLGPLRRMAREEATVLFVRQIFALSDPPTVPKQVCLDLPAESRDLYRKEFGCPIRFGSPRTEIRLCARHLARPLVFSDEDTALVCERRCAELLERLGSPGGVVEGLRRTLLGDPGRFPSLDEAARGLGVSGRTLRRRLSESGTSFQEVLLDVRRGLALDYLQRSELTIDEIASLLGYSETPSFYRAFKQWTGQPPGNFR